jgi:hypothetical protein
VENFPGIVLPEQNVTFRRNDRRPFCMKTSCVVEGLVCTGTSGQWRFSPGDFLKKSRIFSRSPFRQLAFTKQLFSNEIKQILIDFLKGLSIRVNQIDRSPHCVQSRKTLA